jgi:hypothetical protein
MTPCIWLRGRHQLALFTIVALGLTLGGPSATAQAVRAAGGPTKQSGSSNEVIVQAPRHHQRTFGVPPVKAAAFAAEASKEEAWRNYRDSSPLPTGPCPVRPGPGEGVRCGPFDGLEDYPGLRSYSQQ